MPNGRYELMTTGSSYQLRASVLDAGYVGPLLKKAGFTVFDEISDPTIKVPAPSIKEAPGGLLENAPAYCRRTVIGVEQRAFVQTAEMAKNKRKRAPKTVLKLSRAPLALRTLRVTG